MRGLSLLGMALVLGSPIPALRAQEPGDRCVNLDSQHLQEAVIKAEGEAQRCLVAGKLNPPLGRAMMAASRNPEKATFHCSYDLDLLSILAATKHDKARRRSSIDLASNSGRPEPESVFEMREQDWTMFHELIHATDPDGQRIVSTFSHNRYHAADGVYGCELACRGDALPRRSPARMYLFLLEVFTQTQLPVEPGYTCPVRAGPDCEPLGKLAYLCRDWPRWKERVLTPEQRHGLSVFEAAQCFDYAARLLVYYRFKEDKVFPGGAPRDIREKVAGVYLEAAEKSGGEETHALGLRLSSFRRLILELEKTDRLAWLQGFLLARGCAPLAPAP